MWRFRRFWRIVGGIALLACASAIAQELDATLGEQVAMIPGSGFMEGEIEVTVYKPPGEGPFPIVVINHGRAPGNARMQPRYRPALAAREFLQRGYAVVAPMREGFSKSGGNEISGGCNVYSNGLEQARSVRRTLIWLGQQPWADVSRNVVIGQSHGGLTTLAYGTEPHPGTRLLVNFAGGLKQENCTSWQFGLIDAIGRYGGRTALPSIWFYGDNDSYFAPFVWRSAHERYVQAGGRADLVAFGQFGGDSHGMFGTRAGLPIWVPRVMAAMEAVDLPTRDQRSLTEIADIAPPPASGFARVDEVDKVPVRNERAREGYRAWLGAVRPKAFAIHPAKGNWGSAWGGERPYARALASCERFAKEACKLYAVDDAVVWTPE